MFKEAHIPRTLQEVIHYETDVTQSIDEKRDLFYPIVTGLKQDLTGPETSSVNALTENDTDSYSDSDSDSSVESDAGEVCIKKIHKNSPRDGISREEWKVCKKTIKEEQREKRKQKMPKHVKRRKEKNGRHKK